MLQRMLAMPFADVEEPQLHVSVRLGSLRLRPEAARVAVGTLASLVSLSTSLDFGGWRSVRRPTGEKCRPTGPDTRTQRQDIRQDRQHDAAGNDGASETRIRRPGSGRMRPISAIGRDGDEVVTRRSGDSISRRRDGHSRRLIFAADERLGNGNAILPPVDELHARACRRSTPRTRRPERCAAIPDNVAAEYRSA